MNRKVLSILLVCVMLAVLAMSGCGMAEQGRVVQDAVKQDVPENVTQFSTANSDNAISFVIDGTVLTVSGSIPDATKNFALVQLNDAQENTYTEPIQNGRFSIEMELPENSEITVNLYAGAQEYGEYEGIISDFVTVEKTGEAYAFTMAPVYGQNLEIFSREKEPSEYLSQTASILSEDEEVVTLANEITRGISRDYDKVQAIHDWVSANIYYDYDAFYSGDLGDVDAKTVLHTKKSVCAGYANLMAALIRSQGIPCRVQSGFALGVGQEQKWTSANLNENESNHAWNEVYVEDRWMIVDATWDSSNEYRNGTYISGDAITQTYFDCTMEFFSFSHRLMEEME